MRSMSKSVFLMTMVLAVGGYLAPLHAQQKEKGGLLSKVVGEEKASAQQPKPGSDLSKALEEMSAQIDAATKTFKAVADKKLEDAVVEMDGIIGLIDKSLSSLSDGGDLDKELKRTEENRRKILADVKAKWLDAKNSATTRAKWELEIAKNQKLLDELALQRVSLGKARAEIESQRQLVIEEKELFAYYILNDQLKEAQAQLASVIQNVLVVSEKIAQISASSGTETGDGGAR